MGDTLTEKENGGADAEAIRVRVQEGLGCDHWELLLSDLKASFTLQANHCGRSARVP